MNELLETKHEVRQFWERGPCGAKHAAAPWGTREFFDEVEQSRDKLEPFIAQFADFDGARGQQVLEVGSGLGTDLVKFARSGARVTGVDLTERSVELIRTRLALEQLDGDMVLGDAENLPFPDAEFDRVYSWGVLHHTPDPAAAIAEAIRVLRPGGQLCVMLYARHSWVAYGLWIRHALLTGHPQRTLNDVLAAHMESKGTRGFTPAEVRAMLQKLRSVQIQHVGTPYDRRVAGPVARLTGRWLGWFLVIRGRRAS